jgi:hypothetical protein
MKLAIGTCIAVSLSVCAPLFAQSPPSDTGTAVDPQSTAEQADVGEEKAWSLEITVDAVTQYFYRGYNVVSKGWILQPNVDFSYTVFDRDGLTITPHVAGWFSITEEKGPSEPERLAEADLFTGVAITYANFELDIDYNYQGYPSHAGAQVQEIEFVLWYDDSNCWPESSPLAGLYPHVGYYREVEDRNDDDRNAYVEVGVEPTLREVRFAGRAITFSFPVTVGLSADSYYTSASGHNELFGYYAVGAKASAALDERWTLVGEVDYIHLDATSVLDANGGDDAEVIGRVSVVFSL